MRCVHFVGGKVLTQVYGTVVRPRARVVWCVVETVHGKCIPDVFAGM